MPTTHPPAALWELPLVVESSPTSQQLSAQLRFSGALHYSRPNAPKHLIFPEHTILNFIRLSGCGNLTRTISFRPHVFNRHMDLFQHGMMFILQLQPGLKNYETKYKIIVCWMNHLEHPLQLGQVHPATSTKSPTCCLALATLKRRT